MSNILGVVDQLLRRWSLYRFALYVLLFLYGSAVVLSALGFLSYSPVDLLWSVVVALAVCWGANTVFAKVFEASTKLESPLITALILALIITPSKLSDGFSGVVFLGWACLLAIASKYVVAVEKRLVFNPAAFAVALTALTVSQSASWWIGTPPMIPFVVLAGLLLVRKAARFDLVVSFFAVSVATTIAAALLGEGDAGESFQHLVLHSSLFFFAFIMLTEPMTLPLTGTHRKWYGALVGFLFVPSVHIWSLYFTPELALLAGNLFSFIIGPKVKKLLNQKAESLRTTR